MAADIHANLTLQVVVLAGMESRVFDLPSPIDCDEGVGKGPAGETPDADGVPPRSAPSPAIRVPHHAIAETDLAGGGWPHGWSARSPNRLLGRSIRSRCRRGALGIPDSRAHGHSGSSRGVRPRDPRSSRNQ